MKREARGTVGSSCVPSVPSAPHAEETGLCGDANVRTGDATDSVYGSLPEHPFQGIQVDPEARNGLGDNRTADPSQEGHENDGDEWEEVIDRDGRRIWSRAAEPEMELADVPDPCPDCGDIEQWRDLRGGWHCVKCAPCEAGPQLRGTAQRLRREYGLSAREPRGQRSGSGRGRTWPPVVPDSIVADPTPNCGACGLPEVIPGQPGRSVGSCFRCWSGNKC